MIAEFCIEYTNSFTYEKNLLTYCYVIQNYLYVHSYMVMLILTIMTIAFEETVSNPTTVL